MAPMIDVTFLLIAFFMFTINFNNELMNETVQLPTAERARPVEPTSLHTMILNVARDGTVLMPGENISLNDPKQFQEFSRFLEREARLIRVRMREADLDSKDGLGVTVVLRAHERAAYRFVQDLIRACRDAGFNQFSLRTNLPESDGSSKQ